MIYICNIYIIEIIYIMLYIILSVVVSDDFLLDDYSKYQYLSSGHVAIGGVDDSQEFCSLIESMSIMGFTVDDKAG